MNELVSIIVPIYNVEKYIEKCVRSLMAQDYKHIEIILVDDGTPDKSGQIIDKLSSEDERIVTIHKANGGVSSARNAGLDVANGEWVTFVDGDDWVESEYVLALLDIVKKHSCALGVMKNFYSVNSSDSRNSDYTISAVDAQIGIYNDEIDVAVWNKIYNLEFLNKNNIRFDHKIWYGEGMLFNIQSISQTGKVAVGEKAVYHQTFNPDSAMRSFNLKSNYCGLKSMDIQRQLITDERVIKEWKYHKYRFNRSILDGLVRSGTEKQSPDVVKKCIRNLRNNIKIPLSTEKSLKKKLMWIMYSIAPIRMARLSAKKFKERLNKQVREGN